MAEVFVQFRDLVRSQDDQRFVAQACGAPNDQGLWEGWIEFVPIDGGTPLNTPRETTQPNRTDAEYWATGLTATYLEGALARAIGRERPRVPPQARSVFDRPSGDHPAPPHSARAPERAAVLDPFSLYDKGEGLMRQELGALSVWHLVNIAKAYRLSDLPEATLQAMERRELVELITTATAEKAAAADTR